MNTGEGSRDLISGLSENVLCVCLRVSMMSYSVLLVLSDFCLHEDEWQVALQLCPYFVTAAHCALCTLLHCVS